MYLTYDEYVTFGGTIDEAAFDNLEFEARTIVDWWTYNRLQNEEFYSEAVKRCIFKLIEIIRIRQVAGAIDSQTASSSGSTAGIVRQSNDGVDTTYNLATPQETISMTDNQISATIRMYLYDVRNSLGRKVLYRGIYPGE